MPTLPEPGDTKVETVDIYLRIRDRPNVESFDRTYNPPEGWVIQNYDAIVNGARFGDTTGPSVVRVGADSHVVSSQRIHEGLHNLRELSASVSRQVDEETDPQKKEAKKNALDEIKGKINDEFDYWLTLATTYQSSNAGLHITASARATWNTVFGVKIYTSGGKLDADIKITLLFVGNQSFLEAHIAQYTRKLEEIAAV